LAIDDSDVVRHVRSAKDSSWNTLTMPARFAAAGVASKMAARELDRSASASRLPDYLDELDCPAVLPGRLDAPALAFQAGARQRGRTYRFEMPSKRSTDHAARASDY